MCTTCGCEGNGNEITMTVFGKKSETSNHHHEHHHHEHRQGHNGHHHEHSQYIDIETDILTQNNLLAERNRGYFEAKNIIALNLMSSPGSGKTTLLEATIKKIDDDIPVYVIEGDQQTMNDAERIASTPAKVVQVNTGKGCHLDSDMVHKAILKLDPVSNALLFIENVGNLVCPSLFDLGESKRVVIMSVTEGEDKPIKYPDMFVTSDLCIINKTDLLPYLKFDMEKTRDYIKRVNHHMEIIELSAETGEGLDKWMDWLKKLSTGTKEKT